MSELEAENSALRARLATMENRVEAADKRNAIKHRMWETERARAEALAATPTPWRPERDAIALIISRMFGFSGASSYVQEATDAILALGSQPPDMAAPHVFLDCDGVLADFDAHGLAYFGMPPRQAEAELGAKEFWRQLEARGDFYRSMPLMSDAKALYEAVKHLSPTILTGCPKGNWAQGQKVAWAAEHFPGVPIITCRSSEKITYAKPGDVLIDDWPQHRHHWIAGGGHFIVHHDAETSLAALWAHYPELKAARAFAASEGEHVSERNTP